MDKVTLVKQEVHKAEWSARIQACRSSGLTVIQWCRENGINPKTYYYHLRKVREGVCEQIPVAITSLPAKNNPAVTVRNTSGVTAEFADGTSVETIEAVIRAMSLRLS
jgi:hypothetical protein